MKNKLERLMEKAESYPTIGANKKVLYEKYRLHGYSYSKKLFTVKTNGCTYYAVYFTNGETNCLTGLMFYISKDNSCYHIVGHSRTALYNNKQIQEWEKRCRKFH